MGRRGEQRPLPQVDRRPLHQVHHRPPDLWPHPGAM